MDGWIHLPIVVLFCGMVVLQLSAAYKVSEDIVATPGQGALGTAW